MSAKTCPVSTASKPLRNRGSRKSCSRKSLSAVSRFASVAASMLPESLHQGSARDRPAGSDSDYGFDRDFRERCLPLARFLFDSYWRVEADGTESIPARGAAILIGNHSGALPFDAVMLGYAVSMAAGSRVLRPLYHRFIEQHEKVSECLGKLGGVPASYAAADELLSRGELIAIFPEGVAGVAKGFEQRYRLRRFATSAARLSWKYKIPIVPFSVVGAEEIYPLLGCSRRLGAAVGAPHLPITPLFPLLGPLGMIPLPTKWTIRFGKRVYLYRESRFRSAPEPDFDAMAARLRKTVQLQVDRTRRARTSVFSR